MRKVVLGSTMHSRKGMHSKIHSTSVTHVSGKVRHKEMLQRRASNATQSRRYIVTDRHAMRSLSISIPSVANQRFDRCRLDHRSTPPTFGPQMTGSNQTYQFTTVISPSSHTISLPCIPLKRPIRSPSTPKSCLSTIHSKPP